MERTEIEEAAEKLGLERNTVSKYIVRASVIAFFVFLCLVIILTFLGYRSKPSYPHIRTTKVPRNQLFAMFDFISDEALYGVFCRLTRLGY